MDDEVGALQVREQVGQDGVEGRVAATEHHEARACGQSGVTPPQQVDRAGEDVLALAVGNRADVRDQEFAGWEAEMSAQVFPRMLRAPGVDPPDV